jgi:hypothetical protein
VRDLEELLAKVEPFQIIDPVTENLMLEIMDEVERVVRG